MSDDFKSRNFRLYGTEKGAQINNILFPLGINSINNLRKTGYIDAEILAQDIQNNRVFIKNGVVVDNNNRIVQHSGNGVYHILSENVNKGNNLAGSIFDNNKHETNKNIEQFVTSKYYILNEHGQEVPTDFNGNHLNSNNSNNFNSAINQQTNQTHNNQIYTNDDNIKQVSRIVKKFAPSQTVLGLLGDHSYVTSLRLFQKNYIRPGIHLYEFVIPRRIFKYLNDENLTDALQSKDKKLIHYGFLKEEVEIYYPHLIVKKYINPGIQVFYGKIQLQQSQENHEIAKLYFIFEQQNWFNNYVSDVLQNAKY